MNKNLASFSSRFKYGRTTSRSCTNNGKLPNAEEGCNEVQRVFRDNMKLTWEESAALMGIHTLGSAHEELSGYSGLWTTQEKAVLLDNSYFIFLALEGWVPKT